MLGDKSTTTGGGTGEKKKQQTVSLKERLPPRRTSLMRTHIHTQIFTKAEAMYV